MPTQQADQPNQPAQPGAAQGASPDSVFRPRRSYVAGVVFETLGRMGAKIGLVWIVAIAFWAVFAPFLASSHPILMKTADGAVSSPLLEHLNAADVVLLVMSIAAAIMLGIVRVGLFSHRLLGVVWIMLATIPFALWKEIALRWPAWWHAWSQMMATEGVWTKTLVIGLVLLGLLLLVVVLLLPLVLIPLLTPATWRGKLLTGLFMVPVAAALTIWPLAPPTTVAYGKYREMMQDGKIQWAYYAPIPYSPTDRLRDRPERRLKPPWWRPGKEELSADYNHWLGTEDNGADVLSRMIHASRIALAVGFIATGIALVIGIFVGGLMGYFSRAVDLLGMRLVEIFEAVPQLYLLLTFVAFFPRNLYIIMAIIGLTSWTGYARFIRAEFLKLRKQDFVQAALACGLPLRSVLFRHMLPNGVAPVLVSASFGVASAILAEAFLSFLGLGLVDEPSWGQMLSQAIGSTGGFNWWMATFPGLAIFLTVFAYNLVGEALRDAIDPHTRKQAQL